MNPEQKIEYHEENQTMNEKTKAISIETSLKIIKTVQNGQTKVGHENEENLELFYTEKILESLPDEVDALCLQPNMMICREEEETGNSEKNLIWGEEEVLEYVSKLKKQKMWL